MIDCPKFAEMQKIFHGKFMTIAKVQPIAETQIIIMNVNVVDVNVTTRSKVIEDMCSNIDSKEKQKMLLNGRKKSG
jgi:hypothetical protein